MNAPYAPNPHPKFTREWIDHEDAHFRRLHDSGAMADLMHLIARADHLQYTGKGTQP